MRLAHHIGLRPSPRAGVLAVIAGMLAPLAACGPTSPGTSGSASASAAVEHANALDGLGLFERMARATQTVRFGGTRRIEYHYAVAGIPQTLIYSEHVVADGSGGFAIDPERLIAPQLPAPQREAFELLQKEREGFMYRYRDFDVRDAALFAENYSVQAGDAPAPVCGRACTELQVSRRDIASPSRYVAEVDTETGLVLRFDEYTPANVLLSRMEFTDFTLSPVLDGVEFFTPHHPGTPLDAAQEDAATLGFQAAHPRIVPRGYQLLRSELVEEGGRKWVRRFYGDGVENMFFLHAGPSSAVPHDAHGGPVVPGGGGGTGAGITSGPGTHGGVETVTVRVCNVGPWTIAEAVRGSQNLMVIGKATEAEVLQALKSAL